MTREARPSPLRTWIEASRPKTLGAAVAPVMVGSAMAAAAGAFAPLAAFAALWGAGWIQIGTNFANDYHDAKKGADTPERLGPTRATAAGLIAPATMKRAYILAFCMLIPAAVYLAVRGGWPMLVVGLVSVACGILYTAGPFALGYIGVADLFVLVFFGPVAVGGTYWVQAHALPPEVLVAGLGPGLISTAMLTVNNLRDLDTDGRVGKRTLAVRFGATFARWEYTLSLLGGVLLPLALVPWSGAHRWALLAGLVVLAALPALRSVWTERGRPLNAVLGTTGKLLLLWSLLFSVGWML